MIKILQRLESNFLSSEEHSIVFISTWCEQTRLRKTLNVLLDFPIRSGTIWSTVFEKKSNWKNIEEIISRRLTNNVSRRTTPSFVWWTFSNLIQTSRTNKSKGSNRSSNWVFRFVSFLLVFRDITQFDCWRNFTNPKFLRTSTKPIVGKRFSPKTEFISEKKKNFFFACFSFTNFFVFSSKTFVEIRRKHFSNGRRAEQNLGRKSSVESWLKSFGDQRRQSIRIEHFKRTKIFRFQGWKQYFLERLEKYLLKTRNRHGGYLLHQIEQEMKFIESGQLLENLQNDNLFDPMSIAGQLVDWLPESMLIVIDCQKRKRKKISSKIELLFFSSFFCRSDEFRRSKSARLSVVHFRSFRDGRRHVRHAATIFDVFDDDFQLDFPIDRF